jgi:CubicO group peptidase (beta-lactamase class C family)
LKSSWALPAFLWLAASDVALAAQDRFEDTRAYIRAALVEKSVPSVAVAVARDGRIVWEEGFGWADRERRIAATQHTMYSLASISKPITATALMTLVQAGRIDLDRPANGYLGYAKLRARVGDADAATVRRLADHTSGLPLHYQFFYADEPYSRPSMDETILRYGQLLAAPGERYEYSNLGYGVLDYVIERVSGTSYAEFMRREIFVPLGMAHSSVDIGPGLEAYAATRYSGDGAPLPFYDFDHSGASAVFASAHDLARFALFHLKAHLADQKAILTDAAIDEMHRQSSVEDEDEGYGLGFSLWSKDGYSVVAHSGAMGGVSTVMRLYPREGLAIVVLSNASSNLPGQIANRVAARLLPGWTLAPRGGRPAVKAGFAAPEPMRGTWRGELSTYVRNEPFELQFRPDGLVMARLGDQPATLVSEPALDAERFTGLFTGRIGTPDTDHYDYSVSLSLRWRGGVLNGAACALGVDVPRERSALSHWVELRKVPAGESQPPSPSN